MPMAITNANVKPVFPPNIPPIERIIPVRMVSNRNVLILFINIIDRRVHYFK